MKNKIKSQSQLVKIIPLLKKKKLKIVFTNGCFDILHRGHVEYLEKARALGDVLIVALNSDSSVKKIKGPTRPLHPLKDRQVVIAALASVNYVTDFKEETPLSLIKKLKPHRLAKGGDWTTETIVGGKEVVGWGGTVHSITFINGHSTTRIIEKSKLI